ncbi:DUF2795 domain-containing protein [Streptomyces albidus (ex Kaewkla and Franco 2022)]|uniref:DUF2795 domain-containing protein n=1 Tax=Streptomyces albidus (ex Kaewkla and Franco 2022) TaxID=722709 RepID=UPI0015EFCA07|nr:DUF2795 domain-containing protein [Streptomyces albidus (ex Kaewkla and Franco 2022)]
MQRGSDQLSAHRDEEAKRELEGWLRSGHPTRAEEWADAEPSADDDPEITERPVGMPLAPEDRKEADDEEVRSELARHLGRHAFPADRNGLKRALMDQYAPDWQVETVRELPKDGGTYQNVQEVMAALGRKPQS